MAEAEHTLAVFIDFENLALGFRGKKDKRFDIQKVLERLVEKGKIIVKKAYADWADYAEYKKPLHEAAIELIEIPKRSMSGKNSADIRLCVDAIDLCYSKEHIDTFVIVSGDSDFSPLVSKLKENGKRAIGLGMKESSSNLLIGNCDEFIYYEDLERPIGTPPKIEQDLPEKKREAFQLLVDSVVALVRENKEVLWSSMVKETIKRKKPSFNESYHGYRTFSDLLEDAEKEGIIHLRTDTRSGTYVVVGFGKEQKKGLLEELKEVKPLKERKTTKSRWRPRPRKPKPQTTQATPETTQAVADAPNAQETEPVI
ncbi:MAG: NYN domain-containing protein [Deltaproteobacteria bacterium]|nr:NYN domain-containing protein [Deltaproteobacteria bacterium]